MVETVKKRHSPIRHKVRAHKREGKPVESYQRGSGTRPTKARRRVVVGHNPGEEIVIDPEHFGYGAPPTPPRGSPSDYPRIHITEDEKAVGFAEHPFEFDPSPMYMRTGFEGTKEDFLQFMSEEMGRPVTYEEVLKDEHKSPRHIFAYFDPQLLDAVEVLYKKGYTTNWSQGYSYTWRKPGEDKSHIHFPARQLSKEVRRRIKKIPGVEVTEILSEVPNTVALSDRYEDVVELPLSKPVKTAVIHFKFPRSRASPPTPEENQVIHDKWMEIVRRM